MARSSRICFHTEEFGKIISKGGIGSGAAGGFNGDNAGRRTGGIAQENTATCDGRAEMLGFFPDCLLAASK